MLTLIIQAFWLFLPASMANLSPPFARRLPLLDTPIDAGKQFRQKALFGKNKTYRGFFVGIIVSIFFVYVQMLLSSYVSSITLIEYSFSTVFPIGFLLGFGALFGDLIGSFLKRQRGIRSGKSWVPVDQIDWIVGAALFLSLAYSIHWTVILTAIILFGLLHPFASLFCYFIKVKEEKF